MGLEDKLYPLLRLYEASPQPVKSLVGSAYRKMPVSLRLGASYKRFREEAEASESWSADEITDYQFRELRSFENGEMMKNVVIDRLADSFIGVKDAWVTFAASDQPSIGRYVARDAVKLYMNPWYAVTSLTKRRVIRWAGHGRLEAPTPAALTW